MTDVEKQESQKTVVAFITGLLIGGLLVWVFSSTPEQASAPTEDATPSEEVAELNTTKETASTISKTETLSDGSITVSNQKAGKTVTLGGVKTPTKNGWIVVRDYMDGTPGNILGAARYSADEGLMPASVELIRETTVGSSYQVVFFTNEGDLGFKIGEDVAIATGATTFTAN